MKKDGPSLLSNVEKFREDLHESISKVEENQLLRLQKKLTDLWNFIQDELEEREKSVR